MIWLRLTESCLMAFAAAGSTTVLKFQAGDVTYLAPNAATTLIAAGKAERLFARAAA